jgi:hypothetical protein
MSTGETDAGRPVRSLEIRLGIPDGRGHPDYYPVVMLLVDGQQLLANSPGKKLYGNYLAWPPALLGGESVLLPLESAQRVVLWSEYSLCIAPVISVAGGLVAWSDFRHLEYDGEEPVIPAWQAGQGGPIDLPDIVFDEAQYTAEVRRAVAAREWESDSWRTALLLDDRIDGKQWTPREDDELELGSVEPQPPEAFLVTFWTMYDDPPVVVKLVPGPGTPEERAFQMADFLGSHEPEQWPVVAGDIKAALTAGTRRKAAEAALGGVPVTVLGWRVRLPDQIATGLQIKEAAMAAGVPIELDFWLVDVRSMSQTLDDDREITVTADTEFWCFPPGSKPLSERPGS